MKKKTLIKRVKKIKPEYITRDEFHLRIQQTNGVIEDFRNTKIDMKLVNEQNLADHKMILAILDAQHEEVKSLANTINSVSANGTKGLENSLRDIYGKITELYDLTKAIREDDNFKKSFNTWKNATAVRRLFFTKKSYITIIALFFSAHKIQIAGNSILELIWNFVIN